MAVKFLFPSSIAAWSWRLLGEEATKLSVAARTSAFWMALLIRCSQGSASHKAASHLKIRERVLEPTNLRLLDSIAYSSLQEGGPSGASLEFSHPALRKIVKVLLSYRWRHCHLPKHSL